MADNRNHQKEVPFPVRGTPGGYRDIWDDPDDAGATRERLENAAQRNEERAQALSAPVPQPRTADDDGTEGADENPDEDPGADRS